VEEGYHFQLFASFDPAVGRLHVTTSAISQRIKARESDEVMGKFAIMARQLCPVGEAREALQREGHEDQRDSFRIIARHNVLFCCA
jgi:hypothetical protein